MFIPASLVVLIVCLLLLDRTTSRATHVLLTCVGGIALYKLVPEFVLLVAAVCVLVLLLCGLLAACWGAYLGLEWLANALPNWRIFNEPAGGGLLRLLADYWPVWLTGGFVILSLLAHTLLPR